VIDTFSLCVINDPLKSVQEMTRVVKPVTGKVVLLENNISKIPLLAAIQNLLEPLVTHMSKDCRWNVDVHELAVKAGLEEIEAYHRDVDLGTIVLGVYQKPR
jgi:methyltransferase OMS1, mitochondrial